MKSRNWILQKDYIKDADTVVLCKWLKRDAAQSSGTIEFAESASGFGRDFLPVGDIPFVESWLYGNYKRHVVPIEVPIVLRTSEFLGRLYEFMERDKLPSSTQVGKYFVKNVDRFGKFNSLSYEGIIPDPSTIPQGNYLLTEWVDIRSEFRLFVYCDEVLAVKNYQGSPLAYPDADKLMKMVDAYKADEKRPRAYCMDVVVICKQDQTTDTIILGVQPFVNCALYGFEHPDIPDMLEKGVQYYITK